MKSDVLLKIHEANTAGKKAALALIIENKGSTPGEDSSAMAIIEDGETLGTVGGGKIEADIMRRTMEAFKTNEDFEFDYNLSKSGELQMSCGGNSRGYVKLFLPRKRLYIFGAGHVGQKLARVAVKTGFAVDIIDDRSEFKTSPDFAEIDNYYSDNLSQAIEKLTFDKENTYIILCTRGHSTDLDVLKEVIDKDYKYLGMIGSRAKVKDVFGKLRELGYSDEDLSSIHTPVGLDIDNGSVEEIAISILAEILMVKNNKEGLSLSRN